MSLKEIMDRHKIKVDDLSYVSKVPRATIVYISKTNNPKLIQAFKIIDGINFLTEDKFKYLVDDLRVANET